MPNWSNETFARNLQSYVKKIGKTQREVAEVIGVSAPTFNEWIKGKKMPRMAKIEKLANYFGCEKSDLIENKKLQEEIKKEPVKMAQIHIEMIEDIDLSDLFQDFKLLDARERKIVKDLAHSLVETKKAEV